MVLELTSLKKALNSLERALSIEAKLSAQQTFLDEEVALFKAGVIQNFEFSYELCWKFMKRWLESNANELLSIGISRKQLFRYACENGLITDFFAWLKYHEMRNKTSHTYDCLIAEEIFNCAGEFLRDAKNLLIALEQRND